MIIDDLLKYGENGALECKRAKNAVPDSIWETYSSFANTNGGDIFLGVEENKESLSSDDRYIVTGVKNSDKIVSDFWSIINGNKVNVNLLVDDDVKVVDYRGKTIIWIHIPQAGYQNKPIYLNDNPFKGTYKRNYEGDYHCSEQEVRAMIRDSNDTGNDGILLIHYNMDDIDNQTLKAYRTEYELRNPDHVWNTLKDEDFLREFGCYAKDRESGKEYLTVAGLLMFGKGRSIRERFDNIRMDYLDESNLLEGQRWSDRLTYDGTWENNLYNFIKRVMPKLISDLKKPFAMDGIVRVDETEVQKALREAFVNMIIHSDYMTEGILKIQKKDNCFVFSNPGTLKLPLKIIYEGGTSKSRNPHIQTMLRMIGMGENIGSGFPKILHAWNEENWRKPDLSENYDINTVDLKLWMVSLMPKECTDYMHKLYGDHYDTLKSNEQIILCTAYMEGKITNSRLQTMLSMHPADIGKLLYGLVEGGMLLSDNRGRWTNYTINNEYIKLPNQTDTGGNESLEIQLKGSSKVIYDYILKNGNITSADVVRITRITSAVGANKALNKLVAAGLIYGKRNGRYIIYKLR